MGRKALVIVLIIVVVAIVALTIWKLAAKKDRTAPPTSDKTTEADSVTTLTNLKFEGEAAVKDPIGDTNGPYYHKVYVAEGADSLSFNATKTLVLDSGSVPDAIVQPSGDIYVYGVDGAMRGKSGLFVTVSQDGGKNWKSGTLNVKNDRTKFSVGADPQIVALEDGSYRLYYMVNEKPASPNSPIDVSAKNKIYSAKSDDGLNFTEETGIRIEYPQITDPDVIKIGSTWYMYLAQGPKQIVATSADGLNFTYKQDIRQSGSVSKTIVVDGTTYRQYYCANGIVSATTTDGLTFKDDSGVRLTSGTGEILCDPSPVRIGDTWLMIYKSAATPTNKLN